MFTVPFHVVFHALLIFNEKLPTFAYFLELLLCNLMQVHPAMIKHKQLARDEFKKAIIM
jgi:hypothetical protein